MIDNIIIEMEIDDFLLRFNNVAKNKSKIMVAYSGGKDSDIILSLLKHHNLLNKVQLVMFDTGIEFEANKKHISKLISEGIDIKIIRAKKPVPLCTKQYGEPFVSKYVSEMLERLQKHNFSFNEDGLKNYSELSKLYPKCLSAIRWWSNYYGSKYDPNKKNQKDYGGSSKSSFNISRNKLLKEYLLKHGLDFKVSNKCCKFAKKDTSKVFEKEFKPELLITGIRKSEGGIRARTYNQCFIDRGNNMSLWLPIIWWKDDFLESYKSYKKLRFNEAYEIYNLKRTGCAGCPLGRNLSKERAVLKKYEPNLSRGVENIFKNTYRNTEAYNKFKLGGC